MKKYRAVFKWFVFGSAFIVNLTVISKVGFSQLEEKFSIENRILKGKSAVPVAYSALAPESIFSNAEIAGAFYEQAKSLIRTLMGREVEELQKEIVSPPEPLSRPRTDFINRCKSNYDRHCEELRRSDVAISEGKTEIALPSARNDEIAIRVTRTSETASERFFPQATKQDTPLQLIHHSDLQGTINTLPYERIEGRGVRFRYTEIPEKMIGHFWYLKQSYDLRGKSIRIHYSGIVPKELSFLLFRSHWSVKVIYNIHLEDSEETKTITFQILDRLPFKDVSIFELRIERAQAGKPYGDFLIEKVEILENDDNSTSIKTDHEPKPFTFGGPYLQSNIWGGEVRAS